jgi:quercetin dioxygenase-like cupin family protein
VLIVTIYSLCGGWEDANVIEICRLDLGKLVDHQEGAVVSRQVIKAGQRHLFAFDPGRNCEHTAPYDALVEILEGRCVVKISGREHELGSGQAIIMPANEPHAVRAVEKFKMLLTMIRV